MQDQQANNAFESMVLEQARYPQKNTFDLFTELMAGFPVRSTFDYGGDDPFYSQWVSGRAGPAVAIRWSCAAHGTTRTENDIADSAACGYGLLYVLSGGVRITQNGQEIEARAGSAAIYDMDAPGQVDMFEGPARDFLFVNVPRDVAQASDPSQQYRSLLKLITDRTPLLVCLDYLAGVLSSRASQQFDQVYSACSSLFTAEFLASQKNDASHARGGRAASELLARLQDLINREAGNSRLCPEMLAEHCGISVRYVHKLFAEHGLTCQAHINAVRLEYARQELTSSTGRLYVATLAYRWGFSDPSAFGRAFRKRFGCTPGQFRSRNRL